MSVDDNDNKIHCTRKQNLKFPKANTTHFGLKAVHRMCPIIWNFVLYEMKNSASLDTFIKKVKKRTFDKCPCKICKRYNQGIGYLD